MTIHGRNSALLTALCMVFCLALSGQAFAGHDLKIYKAEKHLDLVGDELTYDLSCDKGDYAVDGMWRIDHADQDDDDLYPQSIGRAVDVLEAYPKADTSGADSIYHFRFEKNAIGRAQIKVFATCVGSDTYSSDSHSHTLTYVRASSAPFVAGVAPAQTAQYSKSDICPTNTFVAGTGFKINPANDPDGDPQAYTGRLFESTLTDKNLRGWSWKFNATTLTSVDYYAHCMSKKVPLAGGERHKIVPRFQGDGTTSNPQVNSLDPGVTTQRISCASHYKAIVAGFSIVGGQGSTPDLGLASDGSISGPAFWYLGMDPQPKSRDFRFLNATNSPGSVELQAICLNYRTT